MKPIQIFKPGRHTAASGETIDFTPQILAEMVGTYDPSLHQAPIVVGHPKGDAPAFGWVKGLSLDSSGAIVADPDQLHPDFIEMVKGGSFKQRSASWYPPEAANNPTPGKWHLRHVGFLGAQPPAVKGLAPVEFADDPAHTIEFEETPASAWHVATFLRRMREFLINKFDLETADQVVPSFMAEDAEMTARTPPKKPTESDPSLAYNETETTTMTPEQIAAMQAENARLTAANAAATNRVTELEAANLTLSNQVKDFAETTARVTVEAAVDALIKDGRMLPAQKKAAVDFALSLDDKSASFDFGEGDKVTKLTQRSIYLENLKSAAPVVDFSERSGDQREQIADDSAGVSINPQRVAARMRELTKDGTMSYEEASAQAIAEFSGTGDAK